MRNYINVHIAIDEELYDLFYGVIYKFPFLGIEEKYDELVVSFDTDCWDEGMRKKLISEMKKLDETIKIIEEEAIFDKNWNQEWESNVSPNIVTNKVVITPSWKANEIESEIKIIINPKMSFGTGEHQSTRLICRLMEECVKEGQFWIDAGTGTGILSILAIKLGANRVLSVDNNEWSIQNASENFRLNNVYNKIELQQNSIEDISLPEADGIAANLYSNLLMKMMEKFYHSLYVSSGSLLASGVMIYDEDDIIKCAIRNGFQLQKKLIEDEWISFHFKAGKYE